MEFEITRVNCTSQLGVIKLPDLTNTFYIITDILSN